MTTCWTCRREWAEETFGGDSPVTLLAYLDAPWVCLLPHGHDGPHEWSQLEE
jgi:hypothetical protein